MFRTYHRPDGKTETRAYLLPQRKNGKYGYERKAPVTKGEFAARALFQRITRRASDMTDTEKQEYARLWKKDSYTFNGKKYATLRGYIVARLYAEYRTGVNI